MDDEKYDQNDVLNSKSESRGVGGELGGLPREVIDGLIKAGDDQDLVALRNRTLVALSFYAVLPISSVLELDVSDFKFRWGKPRIRFHDERHGQQYRMIPQGVGHLIDSFIEAADLKGKQHVPLIGKLESSFPRFALSDVLAFLTRWFDELGVLTGVETVDNCTLRNSAIVEYFRQTYGQNVGLAMAGDDFRIFFNAFAETCFRHVTALLSSEAA